MQNASVVELKRALDAYRKVERFHQAVGFNRVTPAKLKTLALAVEPSAAVHRTPFGKYECRIDGKNIRNDDGMHPTPQQAWAFLARYLTTRAAAAEAAANAESDAESIPVTVGKHLELQPMEHAQ